MLQVIPSEITIASFSVIGILTVYIWNAHDKRIAKIESDVLKCPLPNVKTDIAIIKREILWIKEEIKNKRV